MDSVKPEKLTQEHIDYVRANTVEVWNAWESLTGCEIPSNPYYQHEETLHLIHDLCTSMFWKVCEEMSIKEQDISEKLRDWYFLANTYESAYADGSLPEKAHILQPEVMQRFERL